MEKNLKWLGVAAVVAALAGCSTIEKMGDKMSGGSGGERVTLSGSNEVPPVSTSATGSGTVMVASDKSVKVDLKVSGMKPTAAHIHMGAAGANGPVIVPLEKKGESEFVSKSDAKMTEEQYAAYKAGRTYVNVHSDQYKGGEIRAQLRGQ